MKWLVSRFRIHQNAKSTEHVITWPNEWVVLDDLITLYIQRNLGVCQLIALFGILQFCFSVILVSCYFITSWFILFFLYSDTWRTGREYHIIYSSVHQIYLFACYFYLNLCLFMKSMLLHKKKSFIYVTKLVFNKIYCKILSLR